MKFKVEKSLGQFSLVDKLQYVVETLFIIYLSGFQTGVQRPTEVLKWDVMSPQHKEEQNI